MGLDMYIVKREKGNDTFAKDIEVMYWRKEHEIDYWFNNNTKVTVDDWESARMECHLNEKDLNKFYEYIKSIDCGNVFEKFNKIETLNKIKKILEQDDFNKFDYYYTSNW